MSYDLKNKALTLMYRKASILLYLLAWLNSCQKVCSSQFFTNVVITERLSFTDTAAVIIKFEKGSNFLNATESTVVPITSLSTGSYGFSYDFSKTDIDYF